MRHVLVNNTVPVVGLVLIALLVMTLAPARPQMWLYPIVRQAATAKINFETRQMAVYETPHFIIKYTAADQDMVAMVAQAAEAAYSPVTQTLNYTPSEKTMVLIYPNKDELRRAFGWSGDQSAMGVYWGGVIQILSPRQWLKTGDATSEFIHSGPMAHEFTHLVLDHVTSGNYPRWFTEGLAQYVEYKENNYEWITRDNQLTGEIYAMAELDSNFDNLSNQALAYREAFAAVRYIADVYGEDKLQMVVNALKAGNTIEQAISRATGMDYQTYTAAWQAWAVKNLRNYDDK
jgi:hypothetical protein